MVQAHLVHQQLTLQQELDQSLLQSETLIRQANLLYFFMYNKFLSYVLKTAFILSTQNKTERDIANEVVVTSHLYD